MDLDEEGVNLTLTFGVNYVQSTVKLKKFVNIVKDSALSDSSIVFKEISSDTNGKGLYLLSGTENEDNPIYYYRGAVTNNNAMFAGYCWKIVRTTETGGTKLLYNGKPKKEYQSIEKITDSSYRNVTNDVTYPYIFDATTNEWSNTNKPDEMNNEYASISFSVEEPGDYVLDYRFSANESSWGMGELDIYQDGVAIANLSRSESGSMALNDLTTSNMITVKYQMYNYDEFRFSIGKGIGESILKCADTGISNQIDESAYNTSDNSPAYNGYMYGTVYEYKYQTNSNSYLYGTSFTYTDGTYTLTNTRNGLDNTHHYTCYNTTGQCSELSYVYYEGGLSITLKNGKSVEDAFNEMTTNTTNSTIKTKIDNWFHNTFAPYFTNLGKDYNDYLEDTIWCNDRSMNTLGENYTNNGWIPNGGNVYISLNYSTYGRVSEGVPSLTCSNKNDSFTVTESATGNGALTYPVGMLTIDEMVLAGGYFNTNNTFYLNTNQRIWSLSSYGFDNQTAKNFAMTSDGFLHGGSSTKDINGIRPSISISSNVKVSTTGNGTLEKPYEFIIN